MRVLITLILSLSSCTSSCGGRDPYLFHKKMEVDPDFAQYLNEFLRDADDAHLDLIQPMLDLTGISYGTPPEDAVGVCYSFPGVTWITIKPGLDYGPLLMRTLIYHELGHCLLGLDHEDTLEPDIMNSSLPLFRETEWTGLRDRLLRRFVPTY